MSSNKKKTHSYGYDYDFSSEYIEEDQVECRVGRGTMRNNELYYGRYARQSMNPL